MTLSLKDAEGVNIDGIQCKGFQKVDMVSYEGVGHIQAVILQ